MLAIRLQRTGRKGHAQFRMIVQEARRSPSSGRVVEILGNYDPHSKALNIDKEKAKTFLDNGAKPSDRVARILKTEGVKLPSWVKIVDHLDKKTKNPEKLRKNQPKEEAPAEAEAAKVEDASQEVAEEAATSGEVEETPAEAEESTPEESSEENDTSDEAKEPNAATEETDKN
ncbi:MAG: 30S ribosomal protein S16 [Candidatus Saccharibacteria bacterium]|nr:30S ribosomal protein S16 [Candidatus Saccharibacteria bacterium]